MDCKRFGDRLHGSEDESMKRFEVADDDVDSNCSVLRDVAVDVVVCGLRRSGSLSGSLVAVF